MPLTCGRTSATRNAAVRPGNSRVSATGCAFSVTTVTGIAGMAPGAAGGRALLARTSGLHEERADQRQQDGVTAHIVRLHGYDLESRGLAPPTVGGRTCAVWK